MVVVMVAGMAILSVPVRLVADALGIADLYREVPEAGAVVMTLTMVIPMAAWMAVRGHGSRMILEMSIAMAIPVAGLLALAGIGAIDGVAIMTFVDPLMYVAMLVAMVARRGHYTGGSHEGHRGMLAGAPIRAS
jgi:hypothetical protein